MKEDYVPKETHVTYPAGMLKGLSDPSDPTSEQYLVGVTSDGGLMTSAIVPGSSILHSGLLIDNENDVTYTSSTLDVSDYDVIDFQVNTSSSNAHVFIEASYNNSLFCPLTDITESGFYGISDNSFTHIRARVEANDGLVSVAYTAIDRR